MGRVQHWKAQSTPPESILKVVYTIQINDSDVHPEDERGTQVASVADCAVDSSHTIVKARFWPGLSGQSPEKVCRFLLSRSGVADLEHGEGAALEGAEHNPPEQSPDEEAVRRRLRRHEPCA